MHAGTVTGGAIVDAHVHLYDCFDVREFLTGASRNLRAAARCLGLGHGVANVLMLAETHREHAFERLLELARHPEPCGYPARYWRVRRVANDPLALVAEDGGGSEVLIVAGRQIVSSEGLEVLALGTGRCIDDGAPLEALVRRIQLADGIPVIPWGVGKWLGRRGRIVKSLLRSPAEGRFFLGDIQGRPSFWPRSSIFRLAAAVGIGVLPGSDPLPLGTEAVRAGASGFHIDCDLARGAPSEVLKSALRRGAPVRPFMRSEKPWPFLRNQAQLRFRQSSS